MQCCRCSEEMLVVEYDRIEVDYCPECGIWLDAGELELILGEAGGSEPAAVKHSPAAESSPAGPGADTPVKCPVCRSTMDKGRYDDTSTSVVDRCPGGHGMWLDRGELKEIVEAHAGARAGAGSAVTSFLATLFGGEGQ